MSKQRTISQLARDLRPYIAEFAGGASGSGGVIGGGTGVSDHGLLTGLTGDDHPQYLTETRGNALYIQLGDAPTFGAHDLDDPVYHTASGLTVGDVLAADSSTTFSWRPLLLSEVTAIGGEGITISTNTIDADIGDGLAFSSQEIVVNEAFAFDWLGEHTFADDIGGDADEWQITAEGNATFADIQADTLTVDTFIADVNLALAGSEIITKSGATLSRDFTVPSVSGTLYVYDLPGSPDTQVFVSGDVVRLRYINRSAGLIVDYAEGTVSSYANLADGEQSWTWTRTSGLVGQTIYAGMWALDFGTSGDGLIRSTALGDDTPRIDISTWSTTTTNETRRVVLGNLDGVSDADLSPSGYGLYSTNVYLKGDLVAGGGDVVANAYGINIQSGLSSSTSWTNYADKITFATDPASLAQSATVNQQWASRYTDGSDSYNISWDSVRAGTLYGGVTEAQKRIYSEYRDAGDLAVSTAYMIANTTQTSAQVQIGSINSGGTAEIRLQGTVNSLGDILPSVPSYYNIGSASYPFSELHVDTLFAGTTSSVDTGHNHNDLYYTETETDALLAAKAASSHSHGGYATDANLVAHTSDATIHRSINDAGTGSTDLWSADKIDSEITSAVSSLALTATLTAHTSDATIHRSINDAGSGATDLWSADKIGTEIASSVSGLATSASLTSHTGDATLHRIINDAGTSNVELWSAYKIDNTFDAHTNDDDAHHDPVTVGSDLSLAGQHITLGSDVALKDIDNAFTTTQNITGSLIATVDVEAGGDLTVDGTADITGDTTIDGALTLAGHWTISDTDGQIRSTDPAFSASGGGILIDPLGEIYADLLDLRSGRFAAAIMELDSTVVNGGAQLWTPGGPASLYAALTVDGTSSVTIDVADGSAGHFRRFEIGDVIQVAGVADQSLSGTGETSIPVWDYTAAQLSNTPFPAWAWFEIVTENGLTGEDDGYWRYQATLLRRSGNAIFPAGTPIAGYRQATDEDPLGLVGIYANDNFSPRLSVALYGDDPWEQDEIVTLGRLDGTAAGKALADRLDLDRVYGIAFGQLSDAAGSYIAASGDLLRLSNALLESSDGTNTTVQIAPSGRVRFGTDISSADTTLVDFDPAAGTLSLTGVLNLEDGSSIDGRALVTGSLVVPYPGDTDGTYHDRMAIDTNGMRMASNRRIEWMGDHSAFVGGDESPVFTVTGGIGTPYGGTSATYSNYYVSMDWWNEDTSQYDNLLGEINIGFVPAGSTSNPEKIVRLSANDSDTGHTMAEITAYKVIIETREDEYIYSGTDRGLFLEGINQTVPSAGTNKVYKDSNGFLKIA